MRILIIGGTGFIGPFVARQLHDQGHELLLYHRGQTVADLPPAIAHLHGDRDRLADCADDFRRFAPDVVLDMHPMIERHAQMAMATFKGIARRIVAISSVDVYRAFDRLNGRDSGPPDPIPLTEDSPLRDRFYPYRGDTSPALAHLPYLQDYDKLTIERVVMADADLPGTVLRLPMVHGPGDWQHRFFPLVRRMLDGRPAILLEARWARLHAARAYVENVAAAIALATADERATGRIYNVGDADPLTEAEWAAAIGDAAGWRGRIVAISAAQLPSHLQMKADPDHEFYLSSARIRRELGYTEVISREEGLRRTITWERANPPATLDPAQFDYAAEDRALANVKS